MKTQKIWLKTGAVALALVFVGGIFLLIDSFIRTGSVGLIQNSVDDISNTAQSAVEEAVENLGHIGAANASVCNSAFLDDISKRVQHSIYLRQILVENTNGAQFCGSPTAAFEYISVSEHFSIPGSNETLSAVSVSGSEQPHIMFKITQVVDHTQSISAFVEISSALASYRLPQELVRADIVRVDFADGTNLLSIGDADTIDFSSMARDHMVAESKAGELPIVVSAAMPFAYARERRATIYIAVMCIAMILACTYLILGWKIINNMKTPKFDLENAIALREIRPYYQPVVDITSGQVVGCEVLARWIKPDGEIIPPGVFIDYAEVTGLAAPMTISLLEQIQHDLGEVSMRHPNLKISINLFAGHFSDISIVEDIKRVFENSSISPDQLVFEITERYPLGDDTNAREVIEGLHSLGSKLALDDVGTGHCNLAYVQNLGVDIIKIDRVFVSAITAQTQSSPVLDGLIRMAQELKTDIVAEGVETKEQATYLKKRGVKNVQGFLFSPALPGERYVELLDQLNRPELYVVSSNQGNTDDDKATAA